ncbi:hypothetical protein HOT65_gp095 [Salmonella phage S133]|uniref:Uncharacterized protein n=2 Tax=Epseptimavirus TaxID=2732017 RepID=A0A2Z5HRZ1_9CAUD|nr:hypothetical protein HOT60_gp095 [Salmonella phage S114]YP_009805871.1 hypothetical protein HOT65_gp095 [Salmonella phage S133]AXC40330.1 hypothetical protein [Salmonella phage S114]AXC42062.1 hypothetical protein [Salmonella phage S133]
MSSLITRITDRISVEQIAQDTWALNSVKPVDFEVDTWLHDPIYVVFTADIVMQDVISQVSRLPNHVKPTIAGVASVLRNRGADVYNVETNKRPLVARQARPEKKETGEHPSDI